MAAEVAPYKLRSPATHQRLCPNGLRPRLRQEGEEQKRKSPSERKDARSVKTLNAQPDTLC